MSTRIIQFGTSRFLQAHVDLFVHEAHDAGQAIGPIAVVQTSGSPDRAGRVSAFGHPDGYPVIVRGMENGAAVESTVTVRSVDRGLSASTQWDELKTLFATDVRFVVSNTGDRGYEISDGDKGSSLRSGEVPQSFPGKLTALLHHRWRSGAGPITVLPCELVNRNGDILKRCVLGLAEAAGLEPEFSEWLWAEVPFANTLVDRIVSEPIEPVGAVAEPYGLWAIERQGGLTLPFEHPCLVLADDIEPFERLKLHILNLGHTVLAEIWLRENRAADETVRLMLDDMTVRHRLLDVLEKEVVPGFAARGMEAEATAYVATTLERFRNPFLDHRVADIAQNHAMKVERRLAAFLDWIAETGTALEVPVLRSIVHAHQKEVVGA